MHKYWRSELKGEGGEREVKGEREREEKRREFEGYRYIYDVNLTDQIFHTLIL